MGGRGIITAQASATGVGVATARGIEIASPLGAMTSMTNNLKINATATGTSGNADSYGVYAGSMSGGAAIINGSTITAEAHVTDVGGEYEFRLWHVCRWHERDICCSPT